MYRQSARVYDALLRHKDYAGASATLRGTVRGLAPEASTLLDVGCGTGRHLSHLREWFDVQGLDISPEMLEIARARCPGIPLHQASLVDFRLDRRFDVVTCLFGAVAYARDVAGLNRAVRCMADHLEPRGVLVVEPWVTPERFVSGRLVFDAADEPDLKVARMYVTRRAGALSVFDSTYLVATPDGVTSFEERQELGLFTDDEYRAAVAGAGLEVVTTGDLFGYGLYVCRQPAPASVGNG